MKASRIYLVLLLIAISFVLQACGSGTGASDTAGSLTVSKPTSTNNNDGYYTVETTVTYTPPAGKTAQGVQVKLSATDNFGFNYGTVNKSLLSASNSFTQPFIIQQRSESVYVILEASIGDMKSGNFVVIPALAALSVSADTADFIVTDVAGATKSITISGGTGPYSVSSSVPADITVTNSVNATAVITLVKTQTTSTPATALITVTDSTSASRTILVNYFK